MNKKTIIGLSGLILILCASIYTYVLQKDITKIAFTPLDFYFVKNDVPLSDTPNYFIIGNQDEIDALFGIAKTNDNQITPIDFSTDVVVAVALGATNVNTSIKITDVMIKQNDIYVNYELIQSGTNSFASTPLSIIKFPKPKFVMDMFFTKNGLIEDKIAFGRRNLNSPKSFDELKSDYTGTYKGTIPCPDCQGVEITLTINEDMSYEQSTLYLGKNSIPFKELGTWSPTEDLSSIELNDSQTHFFIYDKKTLELMSPDGKRINSELNYKLIKQ